MELNDLSCEIMTMIFSTFTHKELCRSVAPVCKKWRRLAYDPYLWKNVEVNCHRKSTPLLKSLFDRCAFLCEFILCGAKNLASFIPYLENCCHLRKFHISSCNGVNTQCVMKLVQHCPLVEDLKVHYCEEINLDVMNWIKCWTCLKSVDFCVVSGFKNWGRWDNEIAEIIATECKNLENIELNLPGLEENSFQVLGDQKGHLIKKLAMNFKKLTTNSLQLLQNCPFLTKLSLFSCKILQDNSFLVIKELKHLTILQISDAAQMTSLGIRHLFRDKALSGLLELTLDNCENLGDAALKVVVKCCTSLTYLELTYCKISCYGVLLISMHCRNLKNLRVSNIDKISNLYLLNVSSEFPSLSQLTIHCCRNIPRSAVDAIARRNPSVNVCGYFNYS